MKIFQLPDTLANKIAAGEVVERPASVVKELVENSIDANSSWIKIDIIEAGLTQIKITDNGEGMSEEDAERAFLRHATSKIKSETDLFHVKTLGFRGEALASIASVSKLTIKTSQGDHAGVLLTLEGGKVINKNRSDARQGSEIAVKELFFNTPARLKYMKTIHTELGHITDLLNRLALAHPNIRFEATHNDKSLFKTSGTGDLLQVISQIYGMSVAKKMIPVKAETLDFSITGYASLPEVTRASRSYISTIINGRYIRSIPLSKAITKAYYTLLPIHRSPIVVLNITMDPILVDVNVHPTKLEVRFSKEKELFATIEEMIRTKLRSMTLIPEVESSQFKKNKPIQNQFDFDRTPPEPSVSDSFMNHVVNEEQVIIQNEKNLAKEANHTHDIVDQSTDEAPKPNPDWENSDPARNEKRIPPFYPIGQLQGTYIMAQNELGLYMIDQHAAQERIKYEIFKEKLGKPMNNVQDLLLPLTFDFSKQETIFIEKFQDELTAVGLFFEPFGNQAFAIRSYPTWFPEGYEEETIREMIDQIMQNEKVDIEAIREEAAIMMACKGSIKANHYLNNDDMIRLLDSLRRTTDPFTCPHGRPIIVHFSTYELEKMFKRVM